VKIFAVSPPEAVFTQPTFIITRESLLQAGLNPPRIIRVKVTKPKIDPGRFGMRVPQHVEAAGPLNGATAYIPIPNRIIRSPSKELKVAQTRCQRFFGINPVLAKGAILFFIGLQL
jgi:hypothetical protein